MAKRKTKSVVAWLLLILLPLAAYLVSAASTFSSISLDFGSFGGFFRGVGLYVARLTGILCALTAILRPWRLGNRKTERVWATILAVAVALRLICELMQVNTTAGGLSLYVPLSVDALMHAAALVLLLGRRLGKTVKWILAIACTVYTAWMVLGGITMIALSWDVAALRYWLNTLLIAYMRIAMVFFAFAPQMKKDV